MKFPIASKIAARYLFTKKSHSAINLISIVSTCGVAIATMAIVCVLSVFNGFQNIIGDRLDQLSPDIKISSAKGTIINDADSLASSLENLEEVEIAMLSIQRNAFAILGDHQLPINLKGVESDKFQQLTDINKIILDDGCYSLKREPNNISSQTDSQQSSIQPLEESTSEEIDMEALFMTADELYGETDSDRIIQYDALISVGTAVSLSTHPNDSRKLHIYAPRRKGKINLSNPFTSFRHDSLTIAGVFQLEQYEFDKNSVIVDIDVARNIFQYTSEASAIELKIKPEFNPSDYAEKLQQKLGDDFIVEDRLQQHSINFRMINIEKWITFLLLAFILLIASFNIISTMSMLIIEKKEGITTLYRIGASAKTIGDIFKWESLMINSIGALGGIIIGISLCLIQQEFGIIKLNDSANNLIISAYPVLVKTSDIIIVLIPIAIIGTITAIIASRYAKSSLFNKL